MQINKMNNNNTYNIFNKLKTSLSNTQKKLGAHLGKLMHKTTVNHNAILTSIENQLIVSDVNINTTKKIINNLKNHITNFQSNQTIDLYEILYNEILKILIPVEQSLLITEKKPFIILIIGVNGTGKTTTVGKLAYHYQSKNKKVMLVAGDTQRMGATNQLQILGKYSTCTSIITHHDVTSTDPAAIIFYSIQKAILQSIDILIIDTAGRLQNKRHSMEELKKIVKVIKKINNTAPHETMIILDANIGQNSIHQVSLFNKIIPITGIIMTKLDGSGKGGALVTIADHFSLPIRYLGIGQNIEDLQPFKSREFVNAILYTNI